MKTHLFVLCSILYSLKTQAELMPAIHCSFQGINQGINSNHQYNVKIVSIVVETPGHLTPECKIELNKIYEASYKGNSPLQVNSRVRGASVFDETTGCVNDINGQKTQIRPATLTIESEVISPKAQ